MQCLLDDLPLFLDPGPFPVIPAEAGIQSAISATPAPFRVTPAPFFVIPAEAGIQEAVRTNWPKHSHPKLIGRITDQPWT